MKAAADIKPGVYLSRMFISCNMLDCSTGIAVAIASHNRPKAVGCKRQAFAQ